MLHGNVSRNGYGNAVVGRYGACFEEDNIGLCVGELEEVLPRGLDVLVKYGPSLNVRRGQCTTSKRLAKFRWWKYQKPKLNISQKELTSLLFATSSFNRHKMIIVTPRRAVHGDTNTPLSPSTFTRN